jgi:hypothetical protein
MAGEPVGQGEGADAMADGAQLRIESLGITQTKNVEMRRDR